MRAAFYQGNQTVTTGVAPRPEPGPDEVLLRVRRVGICGSDLHIFQGHLDHRVPKGNTIGHEVFAEIVAAPPESGFQPGGRAVVDPVLSCGTCRACRTGVAYLCYGLKVMGVDAPGGMQEYWAVPADRVIAVPSSVDDDNASLVEPLAVATHDVARAEVRAGDAVVVFGGGPIGALIALVCRQRGARVMVVEINPFRIGLLQGLGFDVIGPDRDTTRTVLEWTDGAGADIVFEVTGNAEVVPQLTRLARVWGTISIIAIHSEPVSIDLYPVFARELRLHGSRLYTRAAWLEAIRLLASGSLDIAPLITRRIPLEAVQEGMEQALGGGAVMKILVDLEA